MQRRQIQKGELLSTKAKADFLEAYIDVLESLTPKQQEWLYYFCIETNFNKVEAARRTKYAFPWLSANQMMHNPRIRKALKALIEPLIDPLEVKMKLKAILDYDPVPWYKFMRGEYEISDLVACGADLSLVEGIKEVPAIGGGIVRDVKLMSRTTALSTLAKMVCGPDNVTNVLAGEGGNVTIISQVPGYNERRLVDTSDIEFIDIKSTPLQIEGSYLDDEEDDDI